MKKTLPLAIALAFASVGTLHAQETPMTNQDMDSQNQVQVIQPAQMSTDNVEFTSSMPPTVDYGPRPAFKDLDTSGRGVITEREAAAYPPLANDFLHATHGHRVLTRAEYERWAAKP